MVLSVDILEKFNAFPSFIAGNVIDIKVPFALWDVCNKAGTTVAFDI
jgi:hypothetical protein